MIGKMLIWVSCVLFFFASYFSVSAQQFRSTISGIVYDASSRRPVSDVYVELLNDYYSTIKRTRTESSGRYSFGGLSQGNFKVKVLALGSNYLEQFQDAQLVTFARGNNVETPDNVYIDFYLKPDPRKMDTNLTSGGVVFVQDVPEEARKLYKKGLDQIADKDENGIQTIDRAIVVFPVYYDALNFIGNELVQRLQYEKSLPYLIKAIDINQRSFTSFYALGFACYKLGKYNEALEAFRASTVLGSGSINAHLFYGVILRISGQFKMSESELLRSLNLAKEMQVPEIHWQLGLLYNKLNRNREAADQLEIFLKLQPKSLDAKKISDLIVSLRKEK
jgi:tetratricopeptide (TPR) repeat protein